MIAIGCDHGGLNLKKYLIENLEKDGYEFKDFGTYATDSCDYPDIAEKVCDAVKDNCERGILICGTGIGMSIAANKVGGIRAAHVTDTYSARMAREHNNAQIICMGERITGVDLGLEIARAYLKSEHLGGRHTNRVEKIMAIEKRKL